MDKRKLAIAKAKMAWKQARELEKQSYDKKKLAIKILAQCGYCDCNYPYYETDENENCTVCNKRSKSKILL